MLLQAQKATELAKTAVNNAVSNGPYGPARSGPKGARPAPKPTFTMESLWRLAAWASTAAAALLVAILASRGDVGSERVSVALSSLHLASPPPFPRAAQAPTQPASRGLDIEATTRQLTQAVRALGEDRDRLATRLAVLERNVDDITGSINREIEAAKAAKPAAPQAPQANQASAPWPSEPAPVLTTPDTIVAAVTPVAPPPAGMSSPLPPSPLTPEPAAPSVPTTTASYGVDLGGGRSAVALRARWAGIHSARPQLFEGLEAVAAVRRPTRTRPAELRLIVGPLTSPEAAAQLCASLVPLRLFCRPTEFGGDHLALR